MPVVTAILVYSVDLLLAYRALCLYQMNRKLLIGNAIFFAVSVIISVILLVLAYDGYKGIGTPRYLTGCYTSLAWFMPLVFIPGLVFELWLFALVAFGVWKAARRGTSQRGIVQLIFMDSSKWLTVIAVMIVVNAVMMGAGSEGIHTIGLPLGRSIIITCGCRLILHMRKAAANEQESPPISTAITGNFRQPSPSTFSSSPFRRKIEQDRIDKRTYMLNWAQRIGLPPPLTQDWTFLWDEPVRTLNTGEDLLELEEHSPTTLRNALKHDSVGPVSRFRVSTADRREPRSPIDDDGPEMRFWKPSRGTGTMTSDIDL